ncbi:MAG: hypothetical protein MK105_01615 [Crocinitomicaceae bacterium]|nr:hypothetical protein [Crocinitomicaceae bacterium]
MLNYFSTLVFSLSAIIFTIIISAFTYNAPKSLSLIDAIDNNTITATITSSGNYSGNCINIKLKNNTNVPLKITSLGGTNFSPEDEGEQTLIQLEDIFLVLKPNSEYNGKIAAFCTEASDRCPSNSTKMSPSKNNNPNLDKLVAYLKGKHIPKTTYQDAVWSISDNKPISNIANDNMASKDLRTYLAGLTGQKDSWFSSPQNVQVDESGNFNCETININGALEFDCKKGAKVRQDIMKSNGEPMFESNKTMTAQTTHVKYRFRMSVKGWEKGDYYVKIHDGTTTLATYDFFI